MPVVFFVPNLINFNFFLSVLSFFSGWSTGDSTFLQNILSFFLIVSSFHVLVSSYFPSDLCFLLLLSSFASWYRTILQITFPSSHLSLLSRIDMHVTTSPFQTLFCRFFTQLFSLRTSISCLNSIFHYLSSLISVSYSLVFNSDFKVSYPQGRGVFR